MFAQRPQHHASAAVATTVSAAVASRSTRLSSMSSSPLAPSLAMSSSSAPSTSSSSSACAVATNQDLVQRRLAAARGKKEARRRSLMQRAERNLHIKRLVRDEEKRSATTRSSSVSSSRRGGRRAPPPLVAIKVTVSSSLRDELKLTAREKRGRVFVERSSPALHSLSALRCELHGFFRRLKKGSYLLSASLPDVAPDGTITVQRNSSDSGSGNSGTTTTTKDDDHDSSTSSSSSTAPSEDDGLPDGAWPVNNDDDVARTFAAAQDFYQNIQEQQQQQQQQTSSATGGEGGGGAMKRPSIILHVRRDPNEPPPPPPPSYLQSMADPAESPTMTMLSFYAFPPQGIADPDDFAIRLRGLWKPFQSLGRIYVASEGVNAQMSVPTNVLNEFVEACRSVPELGVYMENGINIDPVPLSREHFFETAGAAAAVSNTTAPFSNLHIRVRTKVVADGLDRSYDWQKAGYDMPPMEWHEKLKRASELRKQQQQQQREEGRTQSNNNKDAVAAPLIFDCRNTYETDLGRFEGAEPLETENFRDSWVALEERLRDTPKDHPIMTYCTGGIRCVKVGAWLTQEMGFTNVSRLAGGIIAYDRTLQEQQQQKQPDDTITTTTEADHTTTTNGGQKEEEASMFRGTNFVFDGRLGRAITDHAMGQCITCGAETSFVSNCRNENCHKRMMQCENCRTSFHGTCSPACQNRILRGSSSSSGGATMPMPPLTPRGLPQQQNTGDASVVLMGEPVAGVRGVDAVAVVGNDDEGSGASFKTLHEYSSGHSSPTPSVYAEMEINTKALIPSGSHMVSGSMQGRLLSQYAAMTRHGRILEIGTFTGYGTACLWEGAAKAGEVIIGTAGAIGTRENGGPYVMSMERDRRALDVAAAQLEVIARHGFEGDAAAEAMCALRAAAGTNGETAAAPVRSEDRISFASEDGIATCELIAVSDALATLEEMAGLGSGHSSSDGGGGDVEHDDLHPPPFDLVFLDADKTRLYEYVDACLVNDRILRKGGLIIVDNVLWKGLVLDVNAGTSTGSRGGRIGGGGGGAGEDAGSSSSDDEEAPDWEETTEQSRKNRRARRLANKMHKFNHQVVRDDRVDVLLLPLRDGLSIIRKK